MNGTDIVSADNETFIYPGSLMNHTRNASLDFFNPMKVYILFEPVPEEGVLSSFSAELGLREFNKTNFYDLIFGDDDDDDDEEATIIIFDEVEPSKIVTLNETVMMFAVFFGAIVYCCK